MLQEPPPGGNQHLSLHSLLAAPLSHSGNSDFQGAHYWSHTCDELHLRGRSSSRGRGQAKWPYNVIASGLAHQGPNVLLLPEAVPRRVHSSALLCLLALQVSCSIGSASSQRHHLPQWLKLQQDATLWLLAASTAGPAGLEPVLLTPKYQMLHLVPAPRSKGPDPELRRGKVTALVGASRTHLLRTTGWMCSPEPRLAQPQQAQRARLNRLREEAAKSRDDRPSAKLEALLMIYTKLEEYETRLESPNHINLTPRLIAELNVQAVHDRTITPSMVLGWCALLGSTLDQRLRQIDHALLYGSLVAQWVDDHERKQDNDGADNVDAREELQQQRQEWEALAFRQDPVEEAGLIAYLTATFAPATKSLKAGSSSALDQLREKIGLDSKIFVRFDEQAVRNAIDEVLSNDLYTAGKRSNLQDLKAHKSVLREIADILNQDLDNIESWQWADGGVRMTMRRHINGKYRVYMDEEVYQAVFLAHIGSMWSNSFHAAFAQFFDHAWKHGASRKPTPDEERIRTKKFYQINESVEAEQTASISYLRKKLFKERFWLSAISPTTRKSFAKAYDNGCDGDNDDGYGTSFVDIKQQLLRMITADQLIQGDLYGQSTVLQSDFRWFGPSLSHTTILTVLKFFGLPQEWLDLFAKFLSPMVSFASDGADVQSRRRSCGTPIAHQISALFGEVVLVTLDFAVNQATHGGYLYRIHDDLWFWGQQDQCAVAWKALQDFCTATGLELNMDKTGACSLKGSASPLSEDDVPVLPAQAKDDDGQQAECGLPWNPIRWGFLVLSAEKGHWDIDLAQLELHIQEMRLQLDATASIMSWGAEEDIGVELIFDDQRVDGWLAYQRAATKSRTPFYWKRIVQLYGAEALEYYGTLNMAQAGSLPMGVTGYLSSEKIREALRGHSHGAVGGLQVRALGRFSEASEREPHRTCRDLEIDARNSSGPIGARGVSSDPTRASG
ncbi:hypothetical protein L1887_61706 [Cichorium endivia]|nr:hypothetical protein L1887_61706 [Cichorium endivia]